MHIIFYQNENDYHFYVKRMPCLMKMIIIFIIKKILNLINMIDFLNYFFLVCEISLFKNIYTYCS